MTYGRVSVAGSKHDLGGAAVRHSAELVRGDLLLGSRRPPHPPLRGTFSPRGEGVLAGVAIGESCNCPTAHSMGATMLGWRNWETSSFCLIMPVSE